MDESETKRLLLLYRETGDIAHFNKLVVGHVGKVRAMVYPMVLNDADADDITQEVFLRVARGIERFRGTARFSTWLYRITMNATRSFLRHRSRNRVAAHDAVPEYASPRPGPDASAMGHETGDLIDAALRALSPPLRAAITLTAIQGMNATDAARAEGCLVATMYWRIHEARRILKQKLGGSE